MEKKRILYPIFDKKGKFAGFLTEKNVKALNLEQKEEYMKVGRRNKKVTYYKLD